MLNALEINTQIAFKPSYFSDFIDYISVKKTTEKNYISNLKSVALWIHENEIAQPTRNDIKAYVQYLDDQGFVAGTKQQYLRTVKQFFKWTALEGYYPNIADNIKGARVRNDNRKKDALTSKDMQIILGSIERKTLVGKRNYAIILLCVTGGLRDIEICRADVEDIKVIAGEKVLFIQGKGRDEKDEYVKLVPELVEALDDYLSNRRSAAKKDPLFSSESLNSYGGRMTVPSISRIIKGILVNAGYDSERITAHSLRHTSITLLLKSGQDIQKAQAHARHQDPATTMIYAHNLEREKDRSELMIYNEIFNEGNLDIREEIVYNIQDLDMEKQQKVLEYIEGLKGVL